MSNPRLEDWSVHRDSRDPYRAPELCQTSVKGKVYGDPTGRFGDGERIRVFPRSATGRTIHTRSSNYDLGEMSPDFRAWLDAEGYVIDPQNALNFTRKESAP